MRIRLLSAAVFMLSTGSAIASPSYSTTLDEATREQARMDLLRLAKADSIDEKAVDLLMSLDVVATSRDTGCPGIDVDVVNATSHTVWDVEVSIEQKDGSNHRSDKIHLPYMTANSKTRLTVSCIDDYTYRSAYDYSGGGAISFDYEARGAKNIAAALTEMMTQQQDYTGSVSGVVPGTTGSQPTLLALALSMNDGDVVDELVAGIAKTGIGTKELGDAIETNPNGPVAKTVAESLAKLPPKQQAQIARALLASPAAKDWEDKLLPMIDKRLCTGARADVVKLWMQAQGETGIPVESLRTRVRARCKPTAADGAAILAALEADPTRAGDVLDAVDPALFERAIKPWKASPPNIMYAFMRDNSDAARFDEVAALLSPGYLAPAMTTVIVGKPNGGTAHKAEWITSNLDKVPSIDSLVTDVTKSLITGEIPAEPMRGVAHAIAAKAPKAADEVMADHAKTHANVFDAEKLAGKADLGEVLAFDATLTGCATSLESLRACAKRVAEYKGGALAKLGDVTRPELVSKMSELLNSTHDHELLASVGGELKAAGFPTSPVIEQACRDAQLAISEGHDAEGALSAVAELDPDAECIERTHSEITSKHRKNILLGIGALLGLVLPIPAGGWAMRRRYRKLQKDLPNLDGDKAPTVDKLEARLGTLGRGLQGGIAAASRELGGSVVAPLLATVDATALEATTSAVKRAIKQGDAASTLLRASQHAIYVLALPVREPRPQLAQRYLGADWPDHLAAVQRTTNLPTLALVVLCGPEAGEASLLVGFSDGTRVSDPEVLLDAKEARARGANPFRHVMTLAAQETA